MRYNLLLLFLMICAISSFAQEAEEEKDEFFHEIEVAHTYINNDKWRGAVAANWKHIYDEIGWRRWGTDAYISRKVKLVSFEAGLTATYTFDRQIVNYLEIRPWLGLRFDFNVKDRLLIMPKFKVESRSFVYANSDDDLYANEHRIRSRFLLSLKYNFIADRDDWKLNPTAEWYFVGKNADAERFSNSTELGLRLIKVFKNEHELAVGYKRESYKSAYISKDKQGHIFILEYAF